MIPIEKSLTALEEFDPDQFREMWRGLTNDERTAMLELPAIRPVIDYAFLRVINAVDAKIDPDDVELIQAALLAVMRHPHHIKQPSLGKFMAMGVLKREEPKKGSIGYPAWREKLRRFRTEEEMGTCKPGRKPKKQK